MSLTYIVDNIILSSKRYDSKNELSFFLENNDGILLPDNCDCGNYILIKMLNQITGDVLNIGVSAYLTSTSQILYVNNSFFALSFDNYVYFISSLCKNDIKEVELDYIVKNLIKLKDNSILVIHELGAICYSYVKEMLWEIQATDVVEYYEINEHELKLFVENDNHIVKKFKE